MRLIDLTGKRFGHLVVIGRSNRKTRSKAAITFWNVRCDCGNYKSVAGGNLKNGRTSTCSSINCPHWRAITNCRIEPKDAGVRQVFHMYRRKCLKKVNREFSLDLEVFGELISGDCYYCGGPPSNVARSDQHAGPFKYNGIDRIDSRLGYIPGNVRTCCGICNSMKNVLSEGEFMEHIAKILRRGAPRPTGDNRMRPMCNMIGETNCGRVLDREDEIKRRSVAHVNRGSQPHEWREMFQCNVCFATDEAVRDAAIKQHDWRDRRMAHDFSLGEAARALGISTSDYSRFERQRGVAPDEVVEAFDRMFSKEVEK